MDREEIRKYFDSICGYEAQKQELIYLCDIMLDPQAYTCLGAALPKNVLLCGLPGVGKTLMAECMIKACRRPAFRCSKNGNEEDFIEIIKNTFEKARQAAPSVILLDDMDKFASYYYEESSELAAVQACIDDVRNEEVFVIATINDGDDLTESLVRPGRFDRYIQVELPDADSTRKIIDRYFSEMKNLSADIDPAELAELAAGMTAVEIRTLANEAGVYAAYERSEQITMRHIVKAFVGKSDNNRCAGLESDETERMVACHEAGHAVISELLERGSVALVFSSEETSASNGMMSRCRSKMKITSGRSRRDALTALGGRAATEMVFGKPDHGAKEDLRMAREAVEREVSGICRYGFAFADLATVSDESANRCNKRDARIRELLAAYYEEARKMLAENREFLERMTEELLRRGYLFQKDICRIRCEIENHRTQAIATTSQDKEKSKEYIEERFEGEIYA